MSPMPPGAVPGAAPLAQALADSRAAAQRRLVAAAQALQAAAPAGGVFLARTLRRKGRPVLQVLLRWPGVLVLQGSDELLREVPMAHMRAPVAQGGAPRDVLALLERQAAQGHLLQATFHPPQARRLCARLGLDGVVRVYAAKGAALLAESEPGQPYRLRADFKPLAAHSLAPRID